VRVDKALNIESWNHLRRECALYTWKRGSNIFFVRWCE